MNRIDAAFADLKARGKTAFIPFITTGDPNLDVTVDIILELERAGADILELGVPYSDPLADGPVIQESSLRALEHRVTVLDCIRTAGRAREAGSKLPFILFTYFNPILQVGIENILKLMRDNDMSGMIIPDLPHEEDAEVRALAQSYGIHLIPLVAPTSSDRIRRIASSASGFIYCVSSLGVTGVRAQFHGGIDEFLATVRSAAEVPIAVGFGISSRDQVARFEGACDAVVVGSALVRIIGEERNGLLNETSKKQSLLQISAFVRQLKGHENEGK